jgi:acyl-CoA synthetase (AMP-forming)/AMP-acid ligase II
LFDHLGVRGSKTALVSEEGKVFSYAELAFLSDLSVAKIEQGSLCFLVCENSPEAIIYYVGLVRKSIATLLIPIDTSESKLNKLILAYSPNYVISNLRTKPLDQNFKAIDTFEKYSLFKSKNIIDHPILPNTAVCLTTSGSTGSPKFVKLSLNNLQSNTKAIIKALNIEESQSTITTMPMSYSYGLSVINTSLAVGGVLVVNSKQVTCKDFWDQVKEHSVNTLSGVPYIYEQLSRLSADFLGRTKIKTFTQAGGKLKKETRQHFIRICEETGISFYVMYGQTEATARISVLPAADFAGFQDAIGFAVPGGELTLIDQLGIKIDSPGVIGELCYKGPNVFQGYAFDRSDLNSSNLSSYKLKTGDLGYFDPEGRFYISGRIKRIAKILGHRINLEEIENFLIERGVEAYCVEFLEKLIVVTTNKEVTLEVRRQIIEYLEINPQLISFKQVPSIPRGDSGKVDYSSIIEFLGGL